MPLVIGLVIIPAVYALIHKANLIKISKKRSILLNVLLVLIAFLFILICWIVRMEPFDFEDHYSVEYMIYSGDYLLYSGLIFMFTPFMWIILIHFLRRIFRALRVRKNAVIKRNDEFDYYRGDLDKVSPAVLMFASKLEMDMRKSIAATILKLKLAAFIEEKEDYFICTMKDDLELSCSERMVLNLIRNHTFDKTLYRKTVEHETMNSKYLTKNYGGVFFRIFKMAVAICIPFIVFVFSLWLDAYTHNNYKVYQEDDGYAYIQLNHDDEIEDLYYNEIKNMNDYYHREMSDGSFDYNYKEIRADKLQYSAVRKALFLNILTNIIIGFFAFFVLFGVYLFVEQICYFNKNYTRTIKGRALLNKAYALKNYLKDYSQIRERTEAELVLWEYYLIYAVALDVNVKLEDVLIEKYLVRNGI